MQWESSYAVAIGRSSFKCSEKVAINFYRQLDVLSQPGVANEILESEP